MDVAVGYGWLLTCVAMADECGWFPSCMAVAVCNSWLANCPWQLDVFDAQVCGYGNWMWLVPTRLRLLPVGCGSVHTSCGGSSWMWLAPHVCGAMADW